MRFPRDTIPDTNTVAVACTRSGAKADPLWCRGRTCRALCTRLEFFAPHAEGGRAFFRSLALSQSIQIWRDQALSRSKVDECVPYSL